MDWLQGNSADCAATPLRKAYVEITTECNLDCGMCVRHLWPGPQRVMAGNTFSAFKDQLRAIPTAVAVSFAGFGEPTVHPQFLEFLREVKEAGLRAELITNGVTLQGAMARTLLDLQLNRLIVSLESVGAEQDILFHGSSATVRANLEAFRQLRGTRAVPEVWVQFVATRRNVHELPKLKSLAPALGFSGIFVTHLLPYKADLVNEVLYRWGTVRRGGSSSHTPTISLPRFDVDSELGAIAGRLQRRGARLQVCGADVAGAGMHCRFVADGCTAITPEGNVSPCLPLMHQYHYYDRSGQREIVPYYLGNVNQMPLRAIWDSEEYRAFRDRVRRFDFSPCIDCDGCELRQSNRSDCVGEEPPRCGACLWAAGLIQCP